MRKQREPGSRQLGDDHQNGAGFSFFARCVSEQQQNTSGTAILTDRILAESALPSHRCEQRLLGITVPQRCANATSPQPTTPAIGFDGAAVRTLEKPGRSDVSTASSHPPRATETQRLGRAQGTSAPLPEKLPNFRDLAIDFFSTATRICL